MESLQLELDFGEVPRGSNNGTDAFLRDIECFSEFGKKTSVHENENSPTAHPTNVFVNEFWTSKQRACHSLHEISYRACFKPQLPSFFIQRLTDPGDVVHDPFMGRGTTLIEAALLGRIPYGCDINPLSRILICPRLCPPSLGEVAQRLDAIDIDVETPAPDDLLAFYHPKTLMQLCALRDYLLLKQREESLDSVDAWIRMIAINRLTGHSPGFFSVYTLPPNQAVSVKSQLKINRKRLQIPPRRDIVKIILKKTKTLLRDISASDLNILQKNVASSLLCTSRASDTPKIAKESVDLVVTSPPFLDIVNYEKDNWLRCWFADIDPTSVPITMEKSVAGWTRAMTEVFRELARILKPGGYVAFEVGEVRGGKVKLEDHVIPCGLEVGLDLVALMINDQKFTKTANCWGVSNNSKGTNTNRIVLFQK